MHKTQTAGQKFSRFIWIGLGVILILIIFFNSFFTIDTGEVGLITRFGAITGEVKTAGLHFKAPFISKVEKMDVRVQKDTAQITAASKDLQTITSEIAVNYAVDSDTAVNVFTHLGRDYRIRVINPAISETTKSVSARFTAEELITRRSEVSDQIKFELSEKLLGYGINVLDINIIDFDFSDEFNQSIENKVKASQDALAAEQKLKQVEFESQQAIARAEGEAQAYRLQAQAIQSSPAIVDLEWIKKWDGHLPTTMLGDSVPLVSLSTP